MKRYSHLGFVFSALWKITVAATTLSLYTDKTETKKILGLDSTIYYVRNGRINYNTVDYKMKIPQGVNCLKFTWYKKPASSQLSPDRISMVGSSTSYVLTLKSKRNLLFSPTVDMPMFGTVPESKTSFCINMTCKGTAEGTAKLVIQLNFTDLDTSKITEIFSLNFVRLKDCLKVPVSAIQPKDNDNQKQDAPSKGAPASDKTKVFYIAVGVACSIIFVIALAVAAIHVHSMPNPSDNKDGSNGDSENPNRQGVRPKLTAAQPAQRPVKKANGYVPIANAPSKDNNGTSHCNGRLPHSDTAADNLRNKTTVVSVDVPPDSNSSKENKGPERTNTNTCVSSYSSLKTDDNRHGPQLKTNSVNSDYVIPPVETSHILADIQAAMTAQKAKYSHKDIRGELKDMSVDMSRITLGSVLHEGTFARIYEGVLTGPEEGKQQGVLVKSVSDTASAEQSNLLLIESCLLRGLTHKNLLPIMSVCLEDSEHPLIMYQFMNRGNLKLYLKKSRSCEGTTQALTTSDLVHMGIQIAKGIQYLARRKIIHKDIAARNCLVDDELNVKVTDCALSRDLFASDYHCLGDNENRPVKWMAVESIEHRRFSVATDVWSYGVTLWELLTLGQQPYANIDAFEMLNFLKHGHRIAQPFNCPDDLFKMLACCWALSEDERPSFGQLIACLTDFQSALSNFI